LKTIEFGGGHIDFLDGVRGLAILYVLFSHTSNNGWHVIPSLNFAMSGKIGVWLFFVLSAFLLTSQLLLAYRNKNLNARFIALYLTARFFRIYPLYVITVLAVLIMMGWLDISRFWNYMILEETSLHLWAIPVEFKFYFLLPVILIFYVYACREKLWLFTVLFLLFYALFSPYGGVLTIDNLIPKSNVSVWIHLPVFLLGCIAAILHERKVYPDKLLVLFAGLIVLLSMPLLSFELFHWAGVELDVAGRRAVAFGVHKELLMGIVWVIIVLGCFNWMPLRSFFSHRLLVLTGQISFSLYLLHYLLIKPLRMFSEASGWEKGVLLFGLSYIIAYISYKYIERPGMAMGKRAISLLRHR